MPYICYIWYNYYKCLIVFNICESWVCMIVTGFLFLFILLHLIADFVFQTNKIAMLKASSVKGILIHILIIVAVQVLGLSIFGIRGIAAGAICGVGHFFIDYLKLYTKKYFENLQFVYFILDQILHIVLILLLTIIFSGKYPILGEKSILIVRLLIGLITVTYVSSVSVKILLRDLDMKIKNDVFFRKNERIIDALTGITSWCVWFLPAIFGIALHIIFLSFYGKYQKIQYKYENKLILTKFITLVLISWLVYGWWSRCPNIVLLQ